ncbi:GNAT family N-acetyltransferase [Sporosarcina highlanderae]|uniref:GNAT family N-acetyltransferase n=1 Tax=Sporosarcina highlanderae TaxID=3035916 RepID=A0ABT8JRW1_9BACL|nr:GNAT family N-acetyltransferase [Sporosarcina highlanderae]MDN4606899.1 GNAT family N-acetyltransferase [Sporosarcina highlanderae]
MPQIHHYWRIPDEQVMDGILQLHNEVFENADELLEKAAKRPNILFVAATEQNKIIGYKIGYELSADRYYSWYGAVQTEFRGKGIASMLMELQHCLVMEAGYKAIETKTRNKWRNMLILNIKHGFDITETFYDDEGIHRITLVKSLIENKEVI